MTQDPNEPERAYEYPPLEERPPPVDPYAPVDYPATYPPPYPPPPGSSAPFPPPYQTPYQPFGTDPYDPYRSHRPPGTNGQAIGALVASLVGLPLCLCGIPSIVGIVLGILAMGETRRTGQDGYGMALAGLIIGAVGLALFSVIWIVVAASPDSGY